MKSLAIGSLGVDYKLKAAVKEVLYTAQIQFRWINKNSDGHNANQISPDLLLTKERVNGIKGFHEGLLTIMISDHANGPVKLGNKQYAIPSCALEELPSILHSEFQNSGEPAKTAAIPANIFHAIVEKSINEIFLLDLDTLTFRFANSSLLENLNYPIDEFYGKHFSELLTDSYRESVLDLISPLLSYELTNLTFQADLLRADKSYYPARVQMERLSENESDFLVGICSDLSELKRSTKLLEERKQVTRELELSNKYKSTFFANLSHEMRTTLNSMLLLSEILSENRQENLSGEQLSYIQTIQNSTNTLLTLLNEILDLSKIESGKMSMRPEYLNIDDFCKELERLFQPVASEKGLRFEFMNDLPQEIPFKTDRLRVEQILKNFISNALKFTHDGSIKLRVFQSDETEKTNSTSNFIAFQVADTGIGIPKDKQETIFKSYMQAADSSTERQFGGTGLGLAISQNIAQLLGGKIRVDSTVGQGSSFTVILPVDSSEAIFKHATAGKIKLTTTPAKRDISKPDKSTFADKIEGTVLLVDDNETHNMALSEFLSFKIKNCITAGSASSAFEILTKEPVDCIILDMYLPDASGKEVLKKLKQDERYASIPTIIYSGKNITGLEEEELESMADAIIQKNIMSYRVLLSKLMGVLQKASEKSRN